MAVGALISLLPQLRDASFQKFSAASDAEVLESFVSQRDEVAFDVLVRRHGPMVYAVCLRLLQHQQDTEDAFQATFLVLAHKAASVSPRSKLAGWLHGVAHKTALKARSRAHHRSEIEKRVPIRSPDDMHADWHATEMEAELDQELSGLPERYRLPIILCDLEGRPRVEVAGTLRCSEGTLSSRLTRGRRLLADRLRRRGVGPAVAGVSLGLTSPSNALPESLILETVPVALSSLACSAGVGGAASPDVARLATGVMKSMFLNKLRLAAVGVLSVATLVVAALASFETQAAPAVTQPPAAAENARASSELGTGIEVRLLQNRKVLKELRCDIDQYDKIMDTLEEAEQMARQKTSDLMTKIRANRGDYNPQQVADLRKAAQEEGAKEFRKAAEGLLVNTLKPAQLKRLEEIDLQVRGYEAFQIPAVAKALSITGKQKEALDESASQIKAELPKAPGAGTGVVGGGGYSPQYVAQVYKTADEAREKGMKQASAILTDEQKAIWKKLTGAPISFPITSLWAQGGYQVGGFQLPPLPPGMILPGAASPRPGT